MYVSSKDISGFILYSVITTLTNMIYFSKLKGLSMLSPGYLTKPNLNPYPLLNMNNVTSHCDEGWVLESHDTCRPCPPGTHYKHGRCRHCPIGEYQSEYATNKCIPCPHGFTMLPGADSVTKCSNGKCGTYLIIVLWL